MWSSISQILTREVITPHTSENIYKADAHLVFLYGMEMWVVVVKILGALENIHIEVAHRVTRKKELLSIQQVYSTNL